MFQLTFERPLSESLVNELFDNHKAFRKELPRAERHEVFQFAIGNPTTPPPPKVRPLSFAAFKRDASLDWRLYVENNSLVVNCLTYTRWKDISDRAFSIMRLACSLLMRQGNNGINGIALQYIDSFRWQGNLDDYDLTSLLDVSSGNVPSFLIENRSSPLWHLHQGWFSELELNIPGRTLQRIHFDAAIEHDAYLVRMDTFLRLDTSSPLRKFGDAFRDGPGDVGKVFDQLHQLDKTLMRSYITSDLAKRISLDG